MDRRHFLGFASAGAMASGLALSFDTGAPGEERLDAARRRAQKSGKQLLVIVVPKDARLGRLHGELFGRLLSEGSNEELAALCCCEVAAIHAEELEVEGDVYLALVHPRREREVLRTLKRLDATAGSSVASFVFPDEAAIARAGQWASEALGQDRLSGINALLPRMRPRLADIDRNAAVVYQLATHADVTTRALWMERLAYAAAQRLWEHAPEDTAWIEGADQPRPDPCPACGLGFCPEPSRNFLDLYTR
ncbi:MAG: hypothetical protein O2816_06325 [Planctomycetota bacterium]|nr:hypothetical protein [Planctomycetota bacterium]